MGIGDGLRQTSFRPWDLWVDTTWVDWTIAAALSAVVAYYRVWEFVEIKEHGTFYGTNAAIALGLLSLGTVAVTLLVTVPPSQQLREALSKTGRNMIGIMFRCLHGLIVATLLFTALFVLDTVDTSLLRSTVFMVAATIMLLRAVRLLWLLQRILMLLL